MKRNRTVLMMAVVMVFTAIPFTNGDAYASTYADVYETRQALQGDNAPQVALPHPQSITSQQDICHRARRKAAESAGATQKNRLLSEKTPQ